jgi:hypothetical protein
MMESGGMPEAAFDQCRYAMMSIIGLDTNRISWK